VNDNFLEKTILVVCYHFKSVLISLIKKKVLILELYCVVLLVYFQCTCS